MKKERKLPLQFLGALFKDKYEELVLQKTFDEANGEEILEALLKSDKGKGKKQ